MPFYRKKIDLSGVPLESLEVFGKIIEGRGRTLQSMSIKLINQHAVTTDLSVTTYPQVVVTMQMLDPLIYGVLGPADIGYISASVIVPTSMVGDSGGQQHGPFPPVVVNNFKDVKTVKSVYLAIENDFGVVAMAIQIEYRESFISDLDIVKGTFGA